MNYGKAQLPNPLVSGRISALCCEITKTWTKYDIFQILLKLGFLASRIKVQMKTYIVALVYFLFTKKTAHQVLRVYPDGGFLLSTRISQISNVLDIYDHHSFFTSQKLNILRLSPFSHTRKGFFKCEIRIQPARARG